MKQLFKYMGKPHNFFEEGFIRLSQLSVLNDPFEASFCERSLDELVCHFDETTSWDPEYGSIEFSKYVKLRINNIGVISFTENKEHLLMWAHYANEHKGVVAGIWCPDNEHIFENLFRADCLVNSSWGQDWSKFNGIPQPVSYRKGLRYRNDKFDYDYSNIALEGADRILYEVFLQKSDEWIYEQEHRVILRLEQADRVIIPDINLIENKNIMEMVKKAPYMLEYSKNEYIINLNEIKNDVERICVARELARLSKDPDIKYFMKLTPNSISDCLIGLKSTFEKSDVQGRHACSIGRFYVWKAKKNLDYYSIEFEEI